MRKSLSHGIVFLFLTVSSAPALSQLEEASNPPAELEPARFNVRLGLGFVAEEPSGIVLGEYFYAPHNGENFVSAYVGLGIGSNIVMVPGGLIFGDLERVLAARTDFGLLLGRNDHHFEFDLTGYFGISEWGGLPAIRMGYRYQPVGQGMVFSATAGVFDWFQVSIGYTL